MAPVLFWLLVILTVITLVGHGIWVLLRAIFRAVSGWPATVKHELSCPFCRQHTPLDRDRCQWCGRELHSGVAKELSDLAAFQRQLTRFEDHGVMTSDEAAPLLAHVKSRRQELLGQPRPQAPMEPVPSSRPVSQPEPPAPPEAKPPRPAVPVLEVIAESEKPAIARPPVRERPPAVAPLPSPAPSPAIAERPPNPPRKSWLERLAGIMEEREIPWAEPIGLLVGGLLILGSSIALVISLWETLEQVPVFKFAVFMAVISITFGMGLYIYHRWKLAATGRFVLMLATLLVPLGFLAIASLSKHDPTPLVLAAEAASLAVSAWLVTLAARVVVPRWPWLEMLAVVGNSAAVLLIARLGSMGLEGFALTGVGLLPVAIFAIAVGGSLRRIFGESSTPAEREPPPARITQAYPFFALLGTAVFATAVSFGLLVASGVHTQGARLALDYLALPLAILSLPVLASGMTIMRAAGDSKGEGLLHTIGTILAMVGTAVMVVAVGMAWPQPAMLIIVGMLVAVTLAWIAMRESMPLAHAGAMGAVTMVYLTGFHLLAGHLPLLATEPLGLKMLQLMTTGQSGAALLGLVGLFGLAGALLARKEQHRHATAYFNGCGVLAALSLLLVTGRALRWRVDQLLAALVYAVEGLGVLAANTRLRRQWMTYLGLGLLVGSMVWTLAGQTSGVGPVWCWALLAQATVFAVVGALFDGFGREQRRGDWRLVFGRPFVDASLATSILASLTMFHGPWLMATWAASTFWLAAIWLVVAWICRSAALLTIGQVILTVATLLATTARLEQHPWYSVPSVRWWDPRCLEIYGIGLALLSLAWAIVRVGTRPIARARPLLNPAAVTVDRGIAHGLVIAQLALMVYHLLPAIGQELVGPPVVSMAPVLAIAPAAWLLVGLMGLTMAVALWGRWQEAELVSSLLLVATVPWLIAESFAPQLASTSSLRWGLSVVFVLVAAVVWMRKWLHAGAVRLQARFDFGQLIPAESKHRLGFPASIARGVLAATTALPVVMLTLLAALLQMSGTSPAGPLQASWFHHVGANVSYLVPLLVVIVGMVGFALRETSAGYAFSAGLIVEMTVVLGYFLALITGGGAIRESELVMALQLATVTPSVWALAWLGARRWVNVWREGPGASSARVLMQLQIGQGVLGNVLLLGSAILAIVFFQRHSGAWPTAVGQGLGWIALVLVVAAVAYRQIQAGKLIRPNLAGLAGMAVLVLLACTISGLRSIEWGYRTLMLGWASYAVFIVLATWWVASLRTRPGAEGPPQALIRMAATWVTMAAVLAVLLGLKLVAQWTLRHSRPEDLLWAASAIAVASVAGATMAVWRRQEGWAFASAVGVNVAASLVVWYFERRLSFESWWTLLLEANVIATSAVALVWLAARRRLYQLREMTIRTSLLLGLQIAIGIAGCVAMLVPPLGRLVASGWLPYWSAQLATPPGLVALLLTATAAAWYLRQVSPRELMHVIAALGLALGVLMACMAVGPGLGQVAIQMLMVSWAVVALVVLGLGYLGQNLRLAEQSNPLEQGCPDAGKPVFPPTYVQFWVTTAGLLAVGLAVLGTIRQWDDPWWPVRTMAAVSLSFGLVAMWLRRAEYVWLSTLLVNLAGSTIWLAYASWHVTGLVEVNALCLAASAAAWSLVGRLHRDGVPAMPALLPFPTIALRMALILAGGVAATTGVWTLLDVPHPALNGLDWTTLAAIALCSLVLLWDRSVRFPLANLYSAGLLGAIMAAEVWATSPRVFVCLIAADLTGFVLAAALAGRLLPRGGLLEPWLAPAQLLVASIAAGLSAWIAVDPTFLAIDHLAGLRLSGPMVGPMAAVGLLATAVVMAGILLGRWRAIWQDTTLVLGLVVMANIGWVWLNPEISAPWLHRSVIGMVAAVAMMLVAGPGLTWLLPAESDWLARAKHVLPPLTGVALGLLAAILVQEGYWRAGGQVDFMALPAVIAVAIALAVLLVGGIVAAVVPRWDPLGLSDRGRTVYVYAAEVLAALIGLHLWLTRSHWFELGIVQSYWMLIVMAVAFGGAVLSELFHRRGFPVLSEPLERTAVLLPLAPAIGFWLPIHPSSSAMLAGNNPAFWFFAGLFYGFMAISRRSFAYGFLAALATNLGLWVLWDRLDWSIFEHPQLWLIPWGLTILAAEYLNHRRLTSAQSAGLRYLGLLLIYISSSTEFLRTVGESLWLPMILIGLSVLGVALGIALRIRSFLFLGITFLTLVLGTMIWYASVQQQHMWVFWIFCIGLGIAVLALVAFYEKRRNDVLAAVRQLKEWQR